MNRFPHPHDRRSWVSIPASRITLVLFSLLGLALGSARTSALEECGAGHTAKNAFSPDGGCDHSQVVLVWYDGQRFVSSYFGSMAGEVERTFGEMGIKIAWRNGDEPGAFEPGLVPSVLLPIVLLDREPSVWGLGESVMGATMGRPGERQAIYIFVPNVIRTLGLDFHGGIESPNGGHQLARALGRILAHEVVHAVAPVHPHRTDGMMGRGLSSRLLLESSMRLDPVCSEAFLVQLADRLQQLEIANEENTPPPQPTHVDDQLGPPAPPL